MKTLRELRRNQTRCVVIVSPSALPKLMRRLGRLPEGTASHLQSYRRAADTPVSSRFGGRENLARLRAGSIVVASTSTDDPEDLVVFAQELAIRLRVFKLILLDRGGGLLDENGDPMSFVEAPDAARCARPPRLRRLMVRPPLDAIGDGVGTVNLVSPR